MANLLGQNIGTNYKGILNLNTLNGNLSGTLQAVTDGDGNASPLQLSTTAVSVANSFSIVKGGRTLFIVPNESGLSGTAIFTTSGVLALGAGNTYTTYLDTSGNFVIGHTTASARLHVRGDGTNPILRTEDNSGNAVGVIVNNSRVDLYGRNFSSNEHIVNIFNGLSWGATSGTVGFLNLANTSFGAGAGSANFRPLAIAYTINNSGAQTGTATGIFLNATETALNGMGHNLMDLGTGGGTYVSRFSVGRIHDAAFRFNNIAAANNWRPLYSISRIGGVVTPAISFGVGSGATGSSAYIASSNDDLYLGTDTSNIFTTNIVLKANAIGFLGLGGLTNAFPAIKRNGAAIDFRLADDSGFCGINSSTISTTGISSFGSGVLYVGANFVNAQGNLGVGFFGNTVASAILQVDSTSRGFLPPRMTTTQKNAITTPATGLVLYDTTLNKLCVYTGSAWETITSV